MKLFIIFTFLFGVLVQAQNITPFDFRAANEALKKAGGFNGTVGTPPRCYPILESSGLSVMSCQLEDKDYTDSVIMKKDFKADQMPAQIQQILPADFYKDAQGKVVSCMFRLKTTNDNKGLVGCHIDPNATREFNNANCGDDFGATHFLSTGVSCSTADGLSSAFVYSTELFSVPELSTLKDVGQLAHLTQKFTSENIFAWMQDDINKGDVTYWKRGVGFVNLSQKKKWGLGQSTGQQEWFHHIINEISPGKAYDYSYENGSLDRWAPFVAVAVGLQENRKLGDRCQLKTNVEVGGRLATIRNSNTLNAEANAELSVRVTGNASLYLRGQSAIELRPDSAVMRNSAALGFSIKNGDFGEIGITDQKGNRRDVPDTKNIYNGKNDLMVFMRYGKQFYGP